MPTENVNQEQVSVEELVSTTAETTEPERQTPQLLTEERVMQMLAEREEKAKEIGRREMQAIKDKELREVSRRARLAEGRARSYEASFETLDEDSRKEVELARYREQDKIYRTQAQEESAGQVQEATLNRLKESLDEEVKGWGLDPSDKRIDYAEDAKDYFEGRSRFTASVRKIVTEQRKVAESELEKRLTAKIDETITQKTVDAGLESHDTSGGSGVSVGEDAFMKTMADPNHVTTQEDLKRINQIQKKIGG